MCSRSLFFSILIFVVASCQTSKNAQLPKIYSSWETGFLLKYRSFEFGPLNYSSKNDPFFKSPQLQDRLRKELRFHFEPINLTYMNSNADMQIFTFFVGNGVATPILPYESPLIRNQRYAIEVDTLVVNQQIIVFDFVDKGSQQLVWRAYSKITTKPESTLFKELPFIIQSLAKEYPG